MRIVVVVLNFVVFLVSSVVIAAEGPPKPGVDTLFAACSLLTRAFTAGMILGTVDGGGWLGLAARWRTLAKSEKRRGSGALSSSLILLAIVCNIALFGFVCWHLAGQYDHPAERGVVPVAVLMVLTSLLSLAVLFRSVARTQARRRAFAETCKRLGEQAKRT